ncbi:HAD family hydrolase [Shewanella avicenniae]|uniref:HAD family hydrolase n=1 Tax=Shewanella avicenniae TaxID=2814294 RepID=A0ABX7QU90_9GAMM|nr:HAD family hydrolase [Shewanella avicenniae]QSX34485.1 HAD family hydrolase [Shewanella avicenniae]
MSNIYLFDWGDTLMVDFVEQQGKMCDWPTVALVDGALDVLKQLAEHHPIYVATNAADSVEADIQLAFERVGLAPYIAGYFCKANLGIGKGTPAFFHKILNTLNVEPEAVIMVGDSFDNDIAPALQAGINAIWFNPKQLHLDTATPVHQISHLSQLCR